MAQAAGLHMKIFDPKSLSLAPFKWRWMIVLGEKTWLLRFPWRGSAPLSF
ncbi:hypothetical protein X975_24125, partial [Stegodyphus mimosarum]